MRPARKAPVPIFVQVGKQVGCIVAGRKLYGYFLEGVDLIGSAEGKSCCFLGVISSINRLITTGRHTIHWRYPAVGAAIGIRAGNDIIALTFSHEGKTQRIFSAVFIGGIHEHGIVVNAAYRSIYDLIQYFAGRESIFCNDPVKCLVNIIADAGEETFLIAVQGLGVGLVPGILVGIGVEPEVPLFPTCSSS